MRAFAATSPATTWWPDPSTGLMWTGSDYSAYFSGISWAKAGNYCSTLKLDGVTGWRLPTIDEAKAMLVPANFAGRDDPATHQRGMPPTPAVYYPAYSSRSFRGGISSSGFRVWTSTLVNPKTAWTVEPGGFFTTVNKTKINDHINKSAVCVHTMDPSTLAVAKQVQIDFPVPDLLTLQADGPLLQGSTSYRNADFQQSLQQAQAALTINPNDAAAAFDVALSYAALQQWNQALTGFQAALKLDKGDGRIKEAITWAQQHQKVAAAGEGKIKAPTPLWW